MILKQFRRAKYMIGLAAIFFGGTPAWAHCDGLDGPVVTAARDALASQNVNRVLIWVGRDDAAEVRAAFDETMAVRGLSPQAQALADRYFFETVVRLHRAGEGEPYTGLKPAGRDLGPAIPAADKAVQSGSSADLTELLSDALRSELDARFNAVIKTKEFAVDDVDAGRRYVEAYVPFVHYVEGIYSATQPHPDGHHDGH